MPSPDTQFARLTRLPPYVFSITTELKMAARRRGEDIIDFGMGNPDGPTPPHIVQKLVETVQRGDTHGYSVSKGIPRLRRAICHWYQKRWGIEFDPESEAIVTIGSKEGIAHLVLATLGRGDTVLVPNPSYPIHIYGPIIAGADIRQIPLAPGIDFFAELEQAIEWSLPKPKMLILNFPANPTAQCVELPFFEKIVALAREHGIYVVHDLAYADITFDGWKAPSIMQVDRRARRRGRVLHDVEELQHGGLAHRLHGRQQGPRERARRASRAITTTARSRRSRSRRSPRSKVRRTAWPRSPAATRRGATCW